MQMLIIYTSPQSNMKKCAFYFAFWRLSLCIILYIKRKKAFPVRVLKRRIEQKYTTLHSQRIAF